MEGTTGFQALRACSLGTEAIKYCKWKNYSNLSVAGKKYKWSEVSICMLSVNDKGSKAQFNHFDLIFNEIRISD